MPDQGPPLTDGEIDALDAGLAALAAADDEALDVVLLDGFLTGVLLQPQAVPRERWLPYVFASDGRADAVPDDARLLSLIDRHANGLAACLAAREGFSPIVYPIEDAAGLPAAGRAGIEALAPWAAGFMSALETFPELLERYGDDAAAADALLGVLRHLPPDPDEAPASARRRDAERRRIERAQPLADLDDAIDHLIDCVLDLADLVRPHRPFMRAAPKPGRNAPCPCGSGRKYKLCHGGTPQA